MDAVTHTIIAIASIAGAWYGGRWALRREARSAFPTAELDRFRELMMAINHMGINPEQHTQKATEPQQLDLFAHEDQAS